MCCLVRLREYLRKSLISGFFFLISAISKTDFSATPRLPGSAAARSPARTACLLQQIQGSPPWRTHSQWRRRRYDELWTIGNSRGAPIRGLLGPWDAFAHWGALGLPFLRSNMRRPPLNAFTSSFRPRRRRIARIISSEGYFTAQHANLPENKPGPPGGRVHPSLTPLAPKWGALQEGRSAGMPS